MRIFGDTAEFRINGSSLFQIAIEIERGVAGQENMMGAVGVTVKISWKKDDWPAKTYPKDGIFYLPDSGEHLTPRELVDDDGVFVTYNCTGGIR